MPVDDVHAEADRLEHALSEELEARIDESLGFPTHDPHGDPIPGADLSWPPEADVKRPRSLDRVMARGALRAITIVMRPVACTRIRFGSSSRSRSPRGRRTGREVGAAPDHGSRPCLPGQGRGRLVKSQSFGCKLSVRYANGDQQTNMPPTQVVNGKVTWQWQVPEFAPPARPG